MKAVKIKMNWAHYYSNDLLEIDSIYLDGQGYRKKEMIHNYLINNPGTIQVDIYPFPNLIPATSPNGEKYVRSSPNNTATDNLLRLPRE